MLNQAIILKVKLRINKIDSQDYNNIEAFQIIEAFNKAQVDWVRRNLHGLNITKEGDEQSTRRIDDLQILLNPNYVLTLTDRQTFYETNSLPLDYLQWKRISAKAKDDCCTKERPLVIYLAEEGNVDVLLRDKNKRPSFDWAETFATMRDNKLQIYTNGEFVVTDPEFVYYKQPRKIEVVGVSNPYTGQSSTTEVLSELKDDLIELIIDETVKILSGDIEAQIQNSRESQAVESNN